MTFDESMLVEIGPLRSAGFALHWLKPRTKRPPFDGWSEAPVATLDDLRATHRPGNNLGLRCGEPSQVGGGYVHVIDIDIRIPDLADEAWDRIAELFPDVDVLTLPCVLSGSGGESRHLYLITDRAFRSKKLAVSEGKHRGTDGKWHYDWEIELFGSGKQVVLPPSIHPDTGKPYQWLREFDLTLLDFGIGPFVPSAAIERLAVAEDATYEFETREPLTFTAAQLERTLADIPDARIDDYHDWITLGQALHHQFGGSTEGYDLWLKHSARSAKFDATDKRGLLRKWRGFGRNRRKPVTMASVVEWAKDARVAALRDAFDEEPDDAPAPATVSFDDLLGEDTPTPAPAPAAPEIDEIDAIGSDTPSATTLESILEGSADLDWISLLDLNEEGAIKPTLPNVELMVCNDPRLVGLAQLNEFTQETVQRLPPGVKPGRRRGSAKPTRQLTGRIWNVKDTLNGELWSDDRDFAIRSIIESPKTQGGYGIKVADRDLKAAIVLASNNNSFHPVREFLTGLTWDGNERLESLFTTYVGAPDDAYTRSVSRLMMVAAVTRIFEPGHKFDFAVILEGLQGKRKSTLIQILGKSWFAELDGDFHDSKQMIELMQGAWIMEIPELSGFGRADVRSIKAFISRQKDRARLAYARRAGEFPRQCIFIGSTNDREYLKDDSGGRRFWPMLCTVSTIDTDALMRNVDQLWAEAVTVYRAMRAEQPFGTLPLYLADAEAAAIAVGLQESRRVESADDAMAGRIGEWLASPVNSGSMDGDTDDQGQPRMRSETCLLELWVDCLAGDPRSFKTAESASLGRAMKLVPGWSTDGTQKRFKRWGKQRLYSLGGERGRLERSGLGYIADEIGA